MVEAHFKSLRCFRKWCRMMPFIIHHYALRRVNTIEGAKLQLATNWRQGNKVRDPEIVDEFCKQQYEKLYNIQ